MNVGEMPQPQGGFEGRLEAELVRVVIARAAAAPGMAAATAGTATVPSTPAKPGRAVMWVRSPGLVERTARRLLRSPGLARALVTTPSLLLPWLIASVAVLTAGTVATIGTGKPLVTLLAPAVAAAGIGYAYGPGIDPAWELSRSMAVSDRMVLLVRGLAVFGIDAGLGLAASAASARAVGITFGWLVPMTALCCLTLAVATLTRSANTGVGAGVAGWALVLLGGQASKGRFTAAIGDSALILPYLAFAAICVAIVLFATRIPRGTT
jgi:hypothetical protein